MAIRIKIKDTKTLKDSIDDLRKKIKDADFDLTQQGVGSIANALLEKKDEIASIGDFASLRELVKEVVGGFNTPKAKEILAKVDEFDRMYQRDPRKGGRNDLWMWEKLLKYVYNIILKASGNESPDVALKREYAERKGNKAEDSKKIGDVLVYAPYNYNETGDFWISEAGFKAADKLDANDLFGDDKDKAHKFASIEEANKFCEEHGIDDFELRDSCGAKVKDSEYDDDLRELISALGEAHNKLIEAYDLASSLEREEVIKSELLYAIEDLEASASELDFEMEGDPVEELISKYGDVNARDEEEMTFDPDDWDMSGGDGPDD